MQSISKLFRSISLRTVLSNIPFLISAFAAGFMFFASINNFPAFIAYSLLLIILVILFPFGFDRIKDSPFSLGISAAVLSCFLSSSFYTPALASKKIHSLVVAAQHILPFTESQLIITGTVLGGILSAYAIWHLLYAAWTGLHIPREISSIRSRLQAYPHLLRSYLILCGIYLLAISALLRANVDFQDDVQRIADGIPGFELFSRHLMGFLIKIVNTGTYLVDLSPLTQILAVLFISAASLILILTFSRKTAISFWSIIAVLPLGLSPYFLECLSFKFDSPYMALTILLSVFPLLFYRCGCRLYIAVTALCILMTSSIYQASLGIFPSAIVLLSYVTWHRENDWKNTLLLILYSVIGYLAGMILYRVFIMRPVSDYVSSEMFSLSQMPGGVYSNLKQYFQFVLFDFDFKWLAAGAVLLVSFVLLHTFDAGNRKWLAFLLSSAALILALCLSFGLYIALTTPSFACRAMYGFGVCIAMIGIICVDFDKSVIARISALYLGWCLIVFSIMYGNVLEEQARYRDFRAEMVLHELNSILDSDSEDPVNMQIIGDFDISPVIRNMPQFSGAMERIVTTTFDTWSNHAFFNYYDLQNINVVRNLDPGTLPVLHDGYYETIYGDGDNILIVLKEF